MEQIETLTHAMEEIQWLPGESCVFYHFAWRGADKLTDGSFRQQFMNVIYTANAVAAAKNAQCAKFVTAGTMEETFVEAYLSSEMNVHPYESAQTDYAISKIAARDMSKMVAYLEKIDYVHTRLSVPLDPSLLRGGYVSATMSKILRREPFQLPSNPKLCDIITTQDVAEAYFRIGEQGRNKANYFIGTSNPRTLKEYFNICEQIRDGHLGAVTASEEAAASHELFSIKSLVDDTGFTPSVSYVELVESLVRA